MILLDDTILLSTIAIQFKLRHGFEIVDFRNFDAPVTLTLDDLEYYTVRFVSSPSIHSIIEHVAALSFSRWKVPDQVASIWGARGQSVAWL